MTARPPFQIGLNGTSAFAEQDPWRDLFAAQGVLALPQILQPDLCDMLLKRAARSTYVQEVPLKVGKRHEEQPQIVGRVISLALQSRPLLDWLQGVTQCGPLRAITGKLAQHLPDGGQALDWHDDMNEVDRKLAIVINMSDGPFTGGQFQLRRKGEEALLFSHDHVEPGSALLFAVRPDLEHRVLPVTGGHPRRVFAGWFLDRADTSGLASV